MSCSHLSPSKYKQKPQEVGVRVEGGDILWKVICYGVIFLDNRNCHKLVVVDIAECL